MNQDEFKELVRRKCPPELRPQCDRAFEVLGDALNRPGRVFYGYEAKDYVGYVGRVAASLPERRNISVSMRGILTGDYFYDMLQPWAKRQRTNIFGSEEPPFDCCRSAIEWIEGQGQELTEDELWRVLEDESDKVFLFTYAIGDRGIEDMRSVFPRIDSKLRPLLLDAEGIAEGTGITRLSLVLLVLCDKKPILPTYEWWGIDIPYELPSDYKPIEHRRKTVTIKLDMPPTRQEWDELYNAVRTHWQEKGGEGVMRKARRKRFSQKDVELYELVQEMGDPPREGVVTFWESVRAKWDERHPGQYTTWKGIQKAYDRVRAALGPDFQAETKDRGREA